MRLRTIVVTIAALTMLPALCSADPFTFTGNFKGDNDVQFFTINIANNDETGRVTTLSTAGFASGGFDPVLTLFALDDPDRPAGAVRGANDDDIFCEGDVCSDSRLSFTDLVAGNYLLALTEYDNCIEVSVCNFEQGNLADGFKVLGGRGFTAPFDGHSTLWEVQISGVDTVQQLPEVPEPASIVLIGSGAAALLRRRFLH